jgi:hypothetical protein
LVPNSRAICFSISCQTQGKKKGGEHTHKKKISHNHDLVLHLTNQSINQICVSCSIIQGGKRRRAGFWRQFRKSLMKRINLLLTCFKAWMSRACVIASTISTSPSLSRRKATKITATKHPKFWILVETLNLLQQAILHLQRRWLMLLRFASIPQKPWQPEFYPTLKNLALKRPNTKGSSESSIRTQISFSLFIAQFLRPSIAHSLSPSLPPSLHPSLLSCN